MVYADSEVNGSRQCDVQRHFSITPSTITVLEESNSTLSCSVPCPDICVHNIFLNNPELGQTVNLLSDAQQFQGLQLILSSNVMKCPNSNCNNALIVNISWTDNKTIQALLDHVRCIFIYSDGCSCHTVTLPVVFKGT